MTDYICPVCNQPGYMLCDHVLAEQTRQWIEKQAALKYAVDHRRDNWNEYMALTAVNPSEVEYF